MRKSSCLWSCFYLQFQRGFSCHCCSRSLLRWDWRGGWIGENWCLGPWRRSYWYFGVSVCPLGLRSSLLCPSCRTCCRNFLYISCSTRSPPSSCSSSFTCCITHGFTSLLPHSSCRNLAGFQGPEAARSSDVALCRLDLGRSLMAHNCRLNKNSTECCSS